MRLKIDGVEQCEHACSLKDGLTVVVLSFVELVHFIVIGKSVFTMNLRSFIETGIFWNNIVYVKVDDEDRKSVV